MPNTIFDRPNLCAFTRLDGLGLEVIDQRIEGSSELSVGDRVLSGGCG